MSPLITGEAAKFAVHNAWYTVSHEATISIVCLSVTSGVGANDSINIGERCSPSFSRKYPPPDGRGLE